MEGSSEQLQQGIQRHKESTGIAQRTLKIAAQTREMGDQINQNLYDQGQQMQRMNDDVEDVHHASKVARIANRQLGFCGWFNCCTGKDKQIQNDIKLMKARSKVEKQMQKEEQNNGDLVDNRELKDSATEGIGNGRPKGQRPKTRKQRIGTLEGEVQDQIDVETDAQDKALDEMSAIVKDIKQQALYMNKEVIRQEDDIENLQNNIISGHAAIKNVEKDVTKRLRPRRR